MVIVQMLLLTNILSSDTDIVPVMNALIIWAVKTVILMEGLSIALNQKGARNDFLIQWYSRIRQEPACC